MGPFLGHKNLTSLLVPYCEVPKTGPFLGPIFGPWNSVIFGNIGSFCVPFLGPTLGPWASELGIVFGALELTVSFWFTCSGQR